VFCLGVWIGSLTSSEKSLSTYGSTLDTYTRYMKSAGSEADILVGIFSTVTKFERRSLIRATYMAQRPPSMEVKFVIGKPKDMAEATVYGTDSSSSFLKFRHLMISL
jgi:hypothetical protein